LAVVADYLLEQERSPIHPPPFTPSFSRKGT
jgi:hypothetical protein